MSLKQLGALRKAVGLEYLSELEFLSGIRNQCVNWQREPGNKSFSVWINRRLALLDYQLSPPNQADDTEYVTRIAYRRALALASTMVSPTDRSSQTSQTKVLGIVNRTCESALRTAGSIACTTLGMGECNYTANLMVPVLKDALPGSERAGELWANVQSEKYLLVVAETESARHMGFFVPLVQGIPGAPSAFFNRHGAAVFKDDLPVFPFDDNVQGRWQLYLSTHLQERMFVSLPFRVPEEHGSLKPIAVLNVNMDPVSTDFTARRCYHSEWLTAARDRVADFIEVAYSAMLIRQHLELGAGRTFISTGSPRWDALIAPQETRVPATERPAAIGVDPNAREDSE